MGGGERVVSEKRLWGTANESARDALLLLDGVRVGRSLGGVDELVGNCLRVIQRVSEPKKRGERGGEGERLTALGDRLDVAERRLANTDGDERDGLVDAAEGRDVDGLAADGALRADPGRVLARAGVDDRVDENLDRVLVGEEVDNLKGVRDDADGLEEVGAGGRSVMRAGVSRLNESGGGGGDAPSASCRCCGRSSSSCLARAQGCQFRPLATVTNGVLARRVLARHLDRFPLPSSSCAASCARPSWCCISPIRARSLAPRSTCQPLAEIESRGD